MLCKLSIDPVASSIHAALDFKGVTANAEDGSFNERPPGADLGSDMNVKAIAIVESGIFNKHQVATAAGVQVRNSKRDGVCVGYSTTKNDK